MTSRLTPGAGNFDVGADEEMFVDVRAVCPGYAAGWVISNS